MSTFPYKRIVVVGSTSSGKSTLAKQLPEKLGADFIELDALYWEANWVEAPDEVFPTRRNSGQLRGLGGGGELSRRARAHLDTRAGDHLARLSISHHLLAIGHPHDPQVWVPRRIMERQRRSLVNASKALV